MNVFVITKTARLPSHWEFEFRFAEKILAEAQELAEDDVAINTSIARHGATVVTQGANILHHCNTGALATVDVGTALGVIYGMCLLGSFVGVGVCSNRTSVREGGAVLSIWHCPQ